MTSSCIPYCNAHYAAIFKRKGKIHVFNTSKEPTREYVIRPSTGALNIHVRIMYYYT